VVAEGRERRTIIYTLQVTVDLPDAADEVDLPDGKVADHLPDAEVVIGHPDAKVDGDLADAESEPLRSLSSSVGSSYSVLTVARNSMMHV
jgi:hypothetical protein